ncbi:MAG: DNA repair protein RecO [Clostridia bacterium]|nr:DNA repair protein RecO [Clostridia bacterium]
MEKYNAICIRSVPWRESDRLLSLFTLEQGLVDCVVRGAMSPKSKWRFCAQPFCFAEYVLTDKFGKKALSEANQIDGFDGIRYDVDRLYCASAVLEFIRQNVAENDSHYQLFLLTVKCLKAIETGAYPQISMLKFFIEAVKTIGYDIDFSNCLSCGKVPIDRVYYDFECAKPCCADCATASMVEMRIETFNLLKAIASAPVDSFSSSDANTYNQVFSDKASAINAVKFISYFLQVRINCKLKTLSEILDLMTK